MVSNLPNESLQHIFSYIKDTNTLFSIIQVNHTWCENGIKFLWKNPFKNSPHRNNLHLINRAKILPILIPNLKKDITSDTLFYYHCFITHLDFDNLFRVVLTFFETNKDILCAMEYLEQFRPEVTENISSLFAYPLIESSKLKQFLKVISLILTILANKCANIKWLKIDLKHDDIKRLLHNKDDLDEILRSSDSDIIGDTVTKIGEYLITSLKLDKAKVLFTNLEYLECGQLSFKLPTLEILSNVCKSLKAIKIDELNYHLIQRPLISLIKNQYHLEEIRIAGIFNNSLNPNYEEIMYGIISSLKSISQSIKKIEICGLIIINDEAFSFLPKCKNLEILKLEDSYISSKNFEWIASAELPKLCSLEIINISSNEEIVKITNPIRVVAQNKLILKNLVELVIENVFIENHNLLEVIGENCRNLVAFFTIITANNDVPSLFTILRNNLKLKDLRLTLPTLYFFNVNTGFIVELAKSLPRMINSIYLSNLINNVNEYKEFLENCKVDELIYYMVNFSPINDISNIDECEEFVKRWTEEKKKMMLDFYKQEDECYKVYVVWDY
ncbi:hypothetical protein RclHR1_01520008 [Rhizophagus clarus]|uniref:F-box domain-containing protein n=1 Tax=Rhizophagus clarus TaxID=94130 RepID=A0A2Z6QEJ0_9GLOM|nr:hypothetical protein RclHR1_01520008 [Rhizophagus clarus]GES78730.1 hypothetical protein GLOIN_2v1545335 [Rhizophagus clarus]